LGQGFACFCGAWFCGVGPCLVPVALGGVRRGCGWGAGPADLAPSKPCFRGRLPL
jgi:hypothetical protein